MASQQRSAADLFGYTHMRLSATEGQQQILYVTLPRSLVATSQGTRSYGRSGHVQPMRSPFRDAWALAELTSSDSDAGTQDVLTVQRRKGAELHSPLQTNHAVAAVTDGGPGKRTQTRMPV